MEELTLEQKKAIALASARVRLQQSEEQNPDPKKREADPLRQIALGGKAAAQGVLSLPMLFGDVLDMPSALAHKVVGAPYLSPSQRANELFDKVTYSPETAGERLSSDIISGTTGALTGGPAKPITALSGAAAGASGGMAREAGGGPIAQIVAALMGGMVPGGVAAAARPFGRILDSAFMPGGNTRAAVRSTANVAGDKDAIAAALAAANRGESAGLAATPTGNAEFAALAKIAEQNAPSKFEAARLLREAENRAKLESLAGGASQEAANASRAGLKSGLNSQLGPQIRQELEKANTAGRILPGLSAEADRLGGAAASKVEDVRRLSKAQEIADELVQSGATRLDRGAPPAPGLPRAGAKYTYGDELSGRTEQAAGKAADDSLILGEAGRFAGRRAESLAAEGFYPIDTSKLNSSLSAKLKDPAIGVSDLNSGVIKAVGDKIEEWTKNNGGVIDAKALHEIRKTVVNEKVEALMGGASKASKQRAAGILQEIRPLIDDAIVEAGGDKWTKVLADYAAGRHAIDQQKMAGKALEWFDKSPNRLVSLVDGNEPKAVSNIFGPGRESFAKEMGGREVPIVEAAGDIKKAARYDELAALGGPKARKEYLGEVSPGALPGILDRTMMIVNAIIRRSEGAGTKQTTDELSRLMQPENVQEFSRLLSKYDPQTIRQLMADALIASGKAGLAQQQE